MDQVLIDKSEAYVRKHFNDQLPTGFTYHNFEHTQKVKRAVIALSEAAKLPDDEKEALVIAALFHDLGVCISADGHEDHSKALATSFLESQHYPSEKIERVQAYIEATKRTHQPADYFEGLIKDADLSGLADPNYLTESQKLRDEWAHVNGQTFSEEQWHILNHNFMKEHTYFTDEAKAKYGASKEKNMAVLLGKMADEPKEKKKKKDKTRKDQGNTISSSKSAQTQFKTALRNHIDLSSIADNKANIMLSVNALIITVALPIIANQVLENANLLLPAIILLVVCVTSMIYATLATRPIRMKGFVSQDDIEQKKSNLFFFGNFYKMSFEEYNSGINQVVADAEILDNSITRDLFFLGKALGAKYQNLRLCYNIFMYGMVAVVLAFSVAFLLSA